MNFKKISSFLIPIYLSVFLFSDTLHALSPRHKNNPIRETIASYDSVPEGDIEERRDSFDVNEEFTAEKNWKRRVIFIGLVISITLDVFLGISLLFMTVFHLDLHFIIEYTILSIDAITLVADLLLFLYYIVQLMKEKYSKATTEKKKKSYSRIFCIIMFSLFLITPLIITPIFLNLSFAITIFMICAGVLSFFVYIVTSCNQFIYKKFKTVLAKKEHLSGSTLIKSILKPVITFSLILTFCCIIPIFSHLTHSFKFAWLMISFTVILLSIPLLMENSLRTSIEEELFNEEMESYLENNPLSNLLPTEMEVSTFGKDLQRLKEILSTKEKPSPFFQKVEEEWQSFQTAFDAWVEDNKNNLLREIAHGDSINLFFEVIVQNKERRKYLKKGLKMLKKDLKKDSPNKNSKLIAMRRYRALSKILSPTLTGRFKKKDKLTQHYRVLLYSS